MVLSATTSSAALTAVASRTSTTPPLDRLLQQFQNYIKHKDALERTLIEMSQDLISERIATEGGGSALTLVNNLYLKNA